MTLTRRGLLKSVLGVGLVAAGLRVASTVTTELLHPGPNQFPGPGVYPLSGTASTGSAATRPVTWSH